MSANVSFGGSTLFLVQQNNKNNNNLSIHHCHPIAPHFWFGCLLSPGHHLNR